MHAGLRRARQCNCHYDRCRETAHVPQLVRDPAGARSLCQWLLLSLSFSYDAEYQY